MVVVETKEVGGCLVIEVEVDLETLRGRWICVDGNIVK